MLGIPLSIPLERLTNPLGLGLASRCARMGAGCAGARALGAALVGGGGGRPHFACGGGSRRLSMPWGRSPPSGLGGSQALDVSPWKTVLMVDTRFGPILQALSKTSCILSQLKRIKDIPPHLLTSPTGYYLGKHCPRAGRTSPTAD